MSTTVKKARRVIGREYLDASSNDVAPLAFARARELFGSRITYSPKVFLPITKLCRDRCGYCTFAQPPAHLPSPYMEIEEILNIVEQGKAAGCTEALLTLGERPELRYDEAARWLAARGYRSTVDYVAEVGRTILHVTGVLPHANCGALYSYELEQLRRVTASQGMMLESLRSLEAHRLAPDKVPARRLATLQAAGELRIPFTTGLLVGIGESRLDRLEALSAIAHSHERHGHVQEVIIQNFLPKERTAMSSWPAADSEEFHWTVAVARLILPDDIHLQAPPNLSDNPAELVRFGIDDFGGISPVTRDHVNPERAWPAVEILGREIDSFHLDLVSRLTVYPEWQNAEYVDLEVLPSVLKLSNSDGLGRDDSWYSGSEATPPEYRTGTSRPHIAQILARTLDGDRLSEHDALTLFTARGADVAAVAEAADELRRRIVGDAVTYVVNRNINYTNVCTFKCKFCAFSKGPLSLNLRGDPYLLDLSEISDRVREAEQRGATEVCLQGGIHPNFDGDYYVDVVAAVRAGSPSIHIHAFSALEVFEGARRSGVSLTTYLERLRDAGLKTLPGTAAEILDDEVRATLCPDKISSQEWLDVHEAAHSVGLRSNVTIMFGSIEHPASWVRHMSVTRDLQDRTSGFTEFVPLPFVHMATPIYLRGRSRKGPTFRETLLMHSVGRLFYHSSIDNVQVSWVKLGIEGSRRILQAGANDVGGTLMDENISRAAGAEHGQEMDVSTLTELVSPLGRPLVQRNTLYGHLNA